MRKATSPIQFVRGAWGFAFDCGPPTERGEEGERGGEGGQKEAKRGRGERERERTRCVLHGKINAFLGAFWDSLYRGRGCSALVPGAERRVRGRRELRLKECLLLVPSARYLPASRHKADPHRQQRQLWNAKVTLSPAHVDSTRI
eukprot:1919672-Rhodomonas_salina.2